MYEKSKDWGKEEKSEDKRSPEEIEKERLGRLLMHMTGDLMATIIYLDNPDSKDWDKLTEHMMLLNKATKYKLNAFKKKIYQAPAIWTTAKQAQYPIGYRCFKEATPDMIERARRKAMHEVEMIIMTR